MKDSRLDGDVTHLLREAGRGDPGALERLIPVVYGELRAMARAQLAGEGRDVTLQPTALVHEAWIKLGGGQGLAGRAHFFGAAARAMRQILVDEARRKGALKRGAGLARAVELVDLCATGDLAPEVLLALDEALARLEGLHERAGRVVLLRFYAGLAMDEIAAILDVPLRSVERDWRFARAWLRDVLSP